MKKIYQLGMRQKPKALLQILITVMNPFIHPKPTGTPSFSEKEARPLPRPNLVLHSRLVHILLVGISKSFFLIHVFNFMIDFFLYKEFVILQLLLNVYFEVNHVIQNPFRLGM